MAVRFFAFDLPRTATFCTGLGITLGPPTEAAFSAQERLLRAPDFLEVFLGLVGIADK